MPKPDTAETAWCAGGKKNLNPKADRREGTADEAEIFIFWRCGICIYFQNIKREKVFRRNEEKTAGEKACTVKTEKILFWNCRLVLLSQILRLTKHGNWLKKGRSF